MLGLGTSITSHYFQSESYVDPSSFSNLALWLQFDKGISTNEPDAGSSDDDSWSHNDKINQWSDQSGNNNHAVQTTSADKPRVDLTDNSGADSGAVKFANNTKFMDLTSNITMSGDFTIMIRFRLDNASAARAFLGDSGTDLFKLEDATEFRSIIGGAGTLAWDETSADAVPGADSTKRSIVTFTRSSGNLSVHVNSGTSGGGFKDIHDDVDWDAAESHSDSDTFTISNIGCQADDTDDFRGWIYDVLIYNGTALTEAQRKQNYDYLIGQTL